MKETVLKVAGKPPTLLDKFLALADWRETGQVKVMIGQLMKGFFGPGGLQEDNVKKTFIEFHDNIRKIVPKERLLEFKVQDGYKPLCDFLGVPVPTAVVDEKEVALPFPRVNEGAAFATRLQIVKRLCNERVMKKLAPVVGLTALGAGLWAMGFLRR
jgi:Sulfotransferase domain